MIHAARILAAGLIFAGAALMPAAAGTVTADQKAEFEEIIRSYLLTHPEIIREMTTTLEQKERLAEDTARAEGLKQNSAAVFKVAADPIVGNAKGDVTIVEFFDYNCSWCKRSVGEVVALVGSDKNLKIVMKEFPIFGEGSEYAARAALAAERQGKYWELHQALFKSEVPVTAEVTDQIAAEVGLDMVKLKADMADEKIAAQVAANQALAQKLAINGTPAFVIDDQLVPGYLPLDGLAAAVAEVRDSGGCKLC